MKIETEDLTEKITPAQESSLVREITQKYDKYNDLRISQLDDARIMRETIYNTDIPKINGWDNKVAQRVDWMECFKFALEQYGIENADNFLKNEQTNVYQTSLLNMNT